MSGVRCINKPHVLLICALCILLLFGCAAKGSASFPYRSSVFQQEIGQEDIASAFSRDLCVVNTDIPANDLTFAEDACVALFDLDARETLYAYRVHERMDPASLTKVMTALIALENGTLDQVLTASTKDYITDKEAQMLVMDKGESMTLHQALHFLLVFSANDVAMMIAEGISGDVDTFVRLMNEKAVELGATNTQFRNPHGLTEEGQYTTAYDMYLIFNAAMRHETFQEIIRLPSYKTQYFRNDGTLKEVEVRSTNAFVREGSGVTPPAGVTVIGGKTGSTSAAGQCLIMLVRNTAGAPFIAVYMHAPDTDTLYRGMGDLLSLVNRSFP